MATGDLKTPPGCSYYSDDSDSMETSELEELSQMRRLIVCGKLRGELPAGFLSCFSNLPNELWVRIWSFLSPTQLRTFRLVSKQWKVLWETHIKIGRKEIDKLSISTDNDSGRLILKYLASSWTGSQLDISNDKESLYQAFSLITFPIDAYTNNTLIITDGAANEQVLQQVALQNWPLQTIAFVGILHSLTKEALYTFLQATCNRMTENSSFCLHFQNASLQPGIISDHMVELCGSNLLELIVDLKDDPHSKHNPVALTNRCLPYFFCNEVLVIIPACPEITLDGIAAALNTFFDPTRKLEERDANYFFPRHHSPRSRLYIGLSDAITAKKIAALEVYANDTLLDRCCYEPSTFALQRGDSVMPEDIKDVGMVEFTYGDRNRGEADGARYYCIEVAEKMNLRSNANSLMTSDVFVRHSSQGCSELSSSHCPSETSSSYNYSSPENWSDFYDYDDDVNY